MTSIDKALQQTQCYNLHMAFHEMTLFKTEDRPRYERELLTARMLAERDLAKNLKARHALER